VRNQRTIKRAVASMSGTKHKQELDEDLDEALKETFPGSDAIAVDARQGKPVRPIDRRPPVITNEIVAQLVQRAKERRER
jgi:hypothetical protein